MSVREWFDLAPATRRTILTAARRHEPTPSHAEAAVALARWWQRRAPFVVGLPVAIGFVVGVIGGTRDSARGIALLVVASVALVVGLAGVGLRARALTAAAPHYQLVTDGEDEAGPLTVRADALDGALGSSYQLVVLVIAGSWLRSATVHPVWFGSWADRWYGLALRLGLALVATLIIGVTVAGWFRRQHAVLDARGIAVRGRIVAWSDVRAYRVEADGQRLLMRWTHSGGEIAVPVSDPAPAIRFTRAHLRG